MYFYKVSIFERMAAILATPPQAMARMRGTSAHPEIQGTVRFYQTNVGVLVAVRITGLPTPAEACASPIFGFHIHEGGDCTGTLEAPFADAGGHYNPGECPHPYHAGDLPPLFGVSGQTFSVFLTDRFTVREVLGKTVILHGFPDDFTTQPAGNSGERIACGVIGRG